MQTNHTPRTAHGKKVPRALAAPMTRIATLPELIAMNRNAATVYVALRWLACGKRQVCTTRAAITKVCGLHREGITAAMSALHDCGWIDKSYGTAKNRKWYRVTFGSKNDFFPKAVKTGLREKSWTRKNRPKGRSRLGRFSRLNSLERVGASLKAPAPLPMGRGGQGSPTTGNITAAPATEEVGGSNGRP